MLGHALGWIFGTGGLKATARQLQGGRGCCGGRRCGGEGAAGEMWRAKVWRPGPARQRGWLVRSSRAAGPSSEAASPARASLAWVAPPGDGRWPPRPAFQAGPQRRLLGLGPGQVRGLGGSGLLAGLLLHPDPFAVHHGHLSTVSEANARRRCAAAPRCGPGRRARGPPARRPGSRCLRGGGPPRARSALRTAAACSAASRVARGRGGLGHLLGGTLEPRRALRGATLLRARLAATTAGSTTGRAGAGGSRSCGAARGGLRALVGVGHAGRDRPGDHPLGRGVRGGLGGLPLGLEGGEPPRRSGPARPAPDLDDDAVVLGLLVLDLSGRGADRSWSREVSADRRTTSAACVSSRSASPSRRSWRQRRWRAPAA
jgi:hypothetical protein